MLLSLRCGCLAILSLSACGPVTGMIVSLEAPAAPIVVPGEPVSATKPTRSATASGTTSQAVIRFGNDCAVLTNGELKLVTDSGLAAIPVGAVGEAMSTGTVRAVFPRGNGVFALAEGGLFHDSNGRLLRSPLSDSIDISTVAEVQTFGAAESEELWLRLNDGTISQVKAGQKRDVVFSLNGTPVTGAIAVVPAGANRAIVATSSRELYRVDLTANSVKRIAIEIGTIATTATDSDGTALLATTQGLLRIGADDVVAQLTFAADGAVAKAVSDVVAVDGQLYVVVDGHVAQRTASTFTIVQDVASASTRSVTRNGSGVVWMLDGAALFKLGAAPPPLSFATDVKPFIVAECQQACHETGANYAPIRHYDVYATAKANAALLVTRVTGANQNSLMPPTTYKVLDASDYANLVQWAQGGQLP